MGGGPSPNQEADEHISKGQSIEDALGKYYENITDEDGDVRIRIKIYKWDHDGPFNEDDYEAVVYFYEKGENLPRCALTFSHYEIVYHYNLRPWDDEDYSPRFTNDFHTPILNSDVHIEGGLLSQSAYIFAKLSTTNNMQVIQTKERKGALPNNHKLKFKVEHIKQNWEVYVNECKSRE